MIGHLSNVVPPVENVVRCSWDIMSVLTVVVIRRVGTCGVIIRRVGVVIRSVGVLRKVGVVIRRVGVIRKVGVVIRRASGGWEIGEVSSQHEKF